MPEIQETAGQAAGPGRWEGITAFQLKCLAMALMLCDHMWYTLFPDQLWMTGIGRIAFPIFAFQAAEGFKHTHDRRAYLKRMLVFAAASEVPFNLMAYGSPVYPFHQNVMVTLAISLVCMGALERARAKGTAAYGAALATMIPAGFAAGFLAFSDYQGYGVLTVLAFHLFHGKRHGWAGELAALSIINWVMLGGLVYKVPLLGHELMIPEQGLAVLALIPIWLYRGRQGRHGKAVQYGCYAFYPAHMLALHAASVLLNG